MPRPPTTPRLTRSQTERRRTAPNAPYQIRTLVHNRHLAPGPFRRAVRRNYNLVVQQIANDVARQAEEEHLARYAEVLAENPQEIDPQMHDAVAVLANRSARRAYRQYLDNDYVSNATRDEHVEMAVFNNLNRRGRRVIEIEPDEEVVEMEVGTEGLEAARERLRLEPNIRLMRRQPNANAWSSI